MGRLTTYVTESGSRYCISEDGLFWRKNDGSRERLYWAYGVDPDLVKSCKAWGDLEGLPQEEIREGVRLFIGNWEVWWLSTVIKEVIKDDR